MVSWLYLLGAIFFEVFATTNLKLADGFTKWLPSVMVVIGYTLSFWLISLAMKTVPLFVAYPVWAGLGTVLVVIASIVLFHDVMTPLKLAGVIIVVIGIVLLNMGGVHRFG